MTWETCRLSWDDVSCSRIGKRITMRIPRQTAQWKERLGNDKDSRIADILGVMMTKPSRAYAERVEQSERRWFRKRKRPVAARVVVVRTTLRKISFHWTVPTKRRTSHIATSTQRPPSQYRIRAVGSSESLVVVSFLTRRRRTKSCVVPATPL